MASLHEDETGAALAGLLDDWSDSELLLPLSPPASPSSEGFDCFPAVSGGAATDDCHEVATLASSSGSPSVAARKGSEDSKNSAAESETTLCVPRSKPKGTGDSNVTRKREREELRRLEAEAYGLEMQLASTLQHRQVAGGGMRHQDGYSTMDMWAQVARNQLLAKQKAELQNATLRELLSEQLRLARSMERMVSRRPSETALYRVFGSTNIHPRKRLRSSTSIDDSLTFQRLFQSVDQSYKELDHVFLRGGDDSKTSSAHAEQSKHRQFIYSAVVPFEMRTAMAAAWEFLSRDQIGVVGGEYHVIEYTPSTIACELVRTVGAPSDASCVGGTQVRVRCGMKKMEERDRIILVWQSSAERELLASSSGTSDPALEQSGWVVLSDAAGGGAATRVQMCIRQLAKLDIPQAAVRSSPNQESLHHHTGAKRENGCSLDPLTELIFRDARENVGEWYQYVENILMEQQRVRTTNRAVG